MEKQETIAFQPPPSATKAEAPRRKLGTEQCRQIAAALNSRGIGSPRLRQTSFI